MVEMECDNDNLRYPQRNVIVKELSMFCPDSSFQNVNCEPASIIKNELSGNGYNEIIAINSNYLQTNEI